MEGKKFIVAITGSIAAYKSASLVRLLIKAGAEVRVIMTKAATKFISPLTLATLSKHEVHTEVTDGAAWNNHVDLGLWADAMIVAPATAASIAKMANGISDNLVTAVYLSAKCPVYFAPAMDRDMWLHPSTQKNISALKSYGNRLIDAEVGELASGLIGKGRMAEPDSIIELLLVESKQSKDLSDLSILITAGPTYEAIDPVRFLGNHSSGKMGIAIAEECAKRGAKVILVLGPSTLQPLSQNIELIRVNSGEEMYEACKQVYASADIAIFAAAVSDYKPVEKALEKIKKTANSFSIEFTKTIDIAKSLGDQKKSNQFHVGFALETENELNYAKQKLEKKKFDLIVLNSLKDKGAGFKGDTNKVTIINPEGQVKPFPLKTKKEVAVDLVNTIVENFVNRTA